MTFQVPLAWMILISLVLMSSCCSLCIRRTVFVNGLRIDSNFKQPILSRTHRTPNEGGTNGRGSAIPNGFRDAKVSEKWHESDT